MNDQGKSSFGFDERVVAVTSYFGPLGLLIYLKEENSKFVRFHAAQSTLSFALLLAVCTLVRHLPAHFFLNWVIGIVSLVLAVHLMLKAYDGQRYKLPVIGKLAFSAVYETTDDTLAIVEDVSGSNDI